MRLLRKDGGPVGTRYRKREFRVRDTYAIDIARVEDQALLLLPRLHRRDGAAPRLNAPRTPAVRSRHFMARWP